MNQHLVRHIFKFKRIYRFESFLRLKNFYYYFNKKRIRPHVFFLILQKKDEIILHKVLN